MGDRRPSRERLDGRRGVHRSSDPSRAPGGTRPRDPRPRRVGAGGRRTPDRGRRGLHARRPQEHRGERRSGRPRKRGFGALPRAPRRRPRLPSPVGPRRRASRRPSARRPAGSRSRRRTPGHGLGRGRLGGQIRSGPGEEDRERNDGTFSSADLSAGGWTVFWQSDLGGPRARLEVVLNENDHESVVLDFPPTSSAGRWSTSIAPRPGGTGPPAGDAFDGPGPGRRELRDPGPDERTGLPASHRRGLDVLDQRFRSPLTFVWRCIPAFFVPPPRRCPCIDCVGVPRRPGAPPASMCNVFMESLV